MTTIHRFAAGALLVITPATQGAPADHWRLVPPLATSCFSDDTFLESIDAARTNLEAQIEKQRKINEAAKEKFDQMDMMEKAQRMQAFMMKNPQAAAKMMQAEAAAGTAANAAVSSANESASRLDAELKRYQAGMRTALEQAAKPIKLKQDELIKAKTVSVGEAAVSMFTNAADHAQYVQLVADENAAVERACAQYFGANGGFHKWLASHRTEVTEKMTSVGDNSDIMLMQMAAMDLPGGGYKSTAGMQQTVNYLQTVRNVYSVRPNRAKASVELKK